MKNIVNCTLEILKSGCYREVAVVKGCPFVEVPLLFKRKARLTSNNIILKLIESLALNGTDCREKHWLTTVTSIRQGFLRTDFDARCVQLGIRSAEPPGKHHYEN